MRIFMFLFFILPLAGAAYVLWRTWCVLPFATPLRVVILLLMVACLGLFFGNFIFHELEHVSLPLASWLYTIGNSTIFLMLYLVLLFGLLQLLCALHVLPSTWLHRSWQGTLCITLSMLLIFTYGYFHYRHKERVEMSLTTGKALPKPLTIVMMSDLHIGYLNQVDELNRWVDKVNAEHPDLVLIGGDIIDSHIHPLNLMHADSAFRRIKAPIVACLGNHEYYAGRKEALDFYQKAGIRLLVDDTVQVAGINVVGRDDRINLGRKSLAQLMSGVDTARYTIVLDHQPYHLEEAESAGADFQLSGHTHYGQVWPISWIEDVMYEDAFGPLQKGNTFYYVTSGIGIWGAPFRIGSRSEYVVCKLQHNG